MHGRYTAFPDVEGRVINTEQFLRLCLQHLRYHALATQKVHMSMLRDGAPFHACTTLARMAHALLLVCDPLSPTVLLSPVTANFAVPFRCARSTRT